MSDHLPRPRLALIGLFLTALITAQVTGAKLLAFSLPVGLPVTGETLVVPGAVFAYALTFFATDCYGELYGRSAARDLVNVGFAMNFVLLALVWVAILAPGFQQSPIDPATFRQVLGASTGVVLGSLTAYLISQHWDVFVFHRLRDVTDGDHLWLRNVASTGTSQAIDTVIFIVLAFYLVPRLQMGTPLVPLSGLAGLILGQYLVKLAIAIVDTPVVYAVVALSDRGGGDPHAIGP